MLTANRTLKALALVLFLLTWSVDGFIDTTLTYLTDRGYFGRPPAALVAWFALQIVIGMLFWVPWFQRNMTRNRALLVISIIIIVLSAGTCFAFQELSPWYPYVLGAIVSPIFVNVPIIFNWVSELVEDPESRGEAIGAMSAVRACSGIFGAILPAIVATAGTACDGDDSNRYANPECGGGPPTKLWNCIYFGLPWLLGCGTASGAVWVLHTRLKDAEEMITVTCPNDGELTKQRRPTALCEKQHFRRTKSRASQPMSDDDLGIGSKVSDGLTGL